MKQTTYTREPYKSTKFTCIVVCLRETKFPLSFFERIRLWVSFSYAQLLIFFLFLFNSIYLRQILVEPKIFSRTGRQGRETDDWDAHVEGGDAHVNKRFPALGNSPSSTQYKTSSEVSDRKRHLVFFLFICLPFQSFGPSLFLLSYFRFFGDRQRARTCRFPCDFVLCT